MIDRSAKRFLLLVASGIAIGVAVWLAVGPSSDDGAPGQLRLTVIDGATGDTVPARLEVRTGRGVYHVAEDAVPAGGDCDMSDDNAGHPDLASVLASFSLRIDNQYLRTEQFYGTGVSTVSLPAGRASIRVFRGPEYYVAEERVLVPADSLVELDVVLTRWTDMPASGWYSADAHLHIPRPVPELDPYISQVLQAEDVHVGNLLQMGKYANFRIAAQHAYGPDGQYRDGDYILAAGQENPRTHFLGHTITLGASRALNDADRYLIYRLLFEEAVALGGMNGFAHASWSGWPEAGFQVREGMAVVMPHDLIDFIEVLQTDFNDYSAWYDVLAMGFRVPPTAGTDYPCSNTQPGHERVYTKVDGPLSYDAWLDGIRSRRTFVTTGPMIEFEIEGTEMGGEISLDSPETVQIEGRAYFDPARDELDAIELVRNGEVIRTVTRPRGASSIEISAEVTVDESTWFALRGRGTRLLERPIGVPWYRPFLRPETDVHSAPIWVTVAGQPIAASERSQEIARGWLARLESLEHALAPERADSLARVLEFPDGDAVPPHVLEDNRDDLLVEIRIAKEYFEGLIR